MLSIKETGILICIIQHCRRIEDKVSGKTSEGFCSDEDAKEIVCFNILQIGELAKSLPLEFIVKYNKMPWKDIKGMRDWVAHGYGTIDLNKVYNTATIDIKPLKDYCQEIINANQQQ